MEKNLESELCGIFRLKPVVKMFIPVESCTIIINLKYNFLE